MRKLWFQAIGRYRYFVLLATLLTSTSFVQNGFAQAIGNYAFTTNNNGSLALDMNGNAIDMTGGTTQLIAPSINSAASALTNIGFDFYFMGSLNTQFNVSSHGLLGLTTAVSTGNNIGGGTGPRIGALVGGTSGTSMATHSTGKVHYKVTGTAPNRVLVVEWLNMSLNSTSTTADATWQVRLYETTGAIELIYGYVSVGAGGPISTVKAGISSTSTAYNVVDFAAHTNSTSTNTSNTLNNGVQTQISSAANGSRRYYRFVPPTPAAPSNLTFSNIYSSSMKMNWTDNATNELLYAIYSSTDGTNYALLTTLAAGANNYTATGLTASTVYYWKVNAITEGGNSTVSGSQLTTTAAPLSGTYTINNTAPTAGTNFNNFTDAINKINAEGITSSVTFNVTAGQTFTEDVPALTATGTSAFSITFQKSGAGANPVIRPTGGTGTADFGFAIDGGDYITIDGIDINIATGSAVEYGYHVRNISATDGAQNNTIKNVNVTLNRANTSSTGIYQAVAVTPTAATGQNDNNKYYNLNIQNVYRGIFLLGNTTYPDTGCEIGTIAGGITYIGGPSAGDIGAGSSGATGVLVNNQSSFKVFNCIVRNVSSGTATRGISTNLSQGNSEIYNNQVYGIRNTSTTSTGVVYGIESTLYTTSGTQSIKIYNNVVYDLTSAYTGAASATRILRGISLGSGTATSAYYVDFNSVRIDGSGSATISSVAIELGGTTAANYVRNNIFANFTGAQTGVAKHYAIRSTSTTAAGGTGSIIDNNLYYVANATNGFPALANTTDQASIFAWRLTMNASHPGIDMNSVSSNPQFVSATDLHINPAVATEVESGGSFFSGSISWATTDIDGNARNNTTPDMGADEGSFTATDLTAPGIVFTDLINTSSTANRTLTDFASISDRSSISTAAGTKPRLYYKRASDANVINDNTPGTSGWKYVEATDAASPFDFTVDYSLLNGGTGVTVGNIIEYFVVAQDAGARVGSWKSTFAATPSSVALTSAAAPIAGTIASYTIVASISGAINVGAGQGYTSLTNTNGLFSALNNNAVGGNITVTIVSDITETGTHQLNQLLEEGAGNWTITIQSDGTSRVLSGTAVSTGAPLIGLTGADRVKIDGGAGKLLTFRNTNATASNTGATIWLVGSSTNCTITNCILENNTTSTSRGVIQLGSGFNTGNTISNNIIRDATAGTTGAPPYGIYNTNSANGSNTIINNEIFNFTSSAIYITAGDTWSITDNKIYQTASRTSALTCINLTGSGNGHTISGNSIGGAAADRTGTALTTTGTFTGVLLTAGTTTPSSLQNNIISNLNITGGTSQTFAGLSIGGGNVNVSGNVIGGAATIKDTIAVSYDARAIYQTGNGAVTIENNTIGNLSYYRVSGDELKGILATAGTVNIKNNTIRNLKSNATASTSFFLSGIHLNTTTSGNTIESNLIHDLLQNNPTGGSIFNMGIVAFSVAGADVTKNKIYNIDGTAATLLHGIYKVSGTATYANNMIALNPSTQNHFVAGMRNDATSGASNWYNNTVSITGANGTGTSNTYGLVRTGAATVDITNNILSNTRTTAGTGYNYAIGNTNATPATGWSASASNYNTFNSADASRLGEWGSGTGQTFAQWKTSSAGDVNSNVGAVSFASATDLHIDNTNANSWNVNGRGIAISSISTDIDGNAKSTTIGTPTDIGADEFSTVATPPVSIASAAPAVNTTTSYTSAGRKVADIIWGAGGTPPTSINLVYYPGVPPAGSPFKSINSYIDVTATGGTGYTYDIRLYYTDAEKNAIPDANLNGQKKDGANPWQPLGGTAGANADGKFVTSTGLNSFSQFSLMDGLLALPVKLVSFTGLLKGGTVDLTWNVTDQQGIQKYIVERSTDGRNFNAIATVNANTLLNYSYKLNDAQPVNGKNYYRLQIVEVGRTTYSSTVIVSLKGRESVILFPTPAKNEITLQVSKAALLNTEAVIADMSGKIMQRLIITQPQEKVNVAGLPAGIYVLRTIDGNTYKIIKQ